MPTCSVDFSPFCLVVSRFEHGQPPKHVPVNFLGHWLRLGHSLARQATSGLDPRRGDQGVDDRPTLMDALFVFSPSAKAQGRAGSVKRKGPRPRARTCEWARVVEARRRRMCSMLYARSKRAAAGPGRAMAPAHNQLCLRPFDQLRGMVVGHPQHSVETGRNIAESRCSMPARLFHDVALDQAFVHEPPFM